MDKADIEHAISIKIRRAVDDAIIKAVDELNRAGHNYQPLDDFLFAWAEPDSDDSLQITCTIGVGISARQNLRPVDHVVESFVSLAESGDDMEATNLNQMEGDIANGGFMQLYNNKDEKFIIESISLLRKIGSQSTLRIVEQALLLFQRERDTLNKYEMIQKKVELLNNRFWNLKESLPLLFMRYRQKENG